MNSNNPQDRTDPRIAQLLEGTLTPAELEMLASQVASDDALRRELREQLQFDEGIRLLLGENREAPVFAETVESRLADDVDRFEFLHRVLDETDGKKQRGFFRRVTVIVGLLTCTAAMLLVAAIVATREDDPIARRIPTIKQIALQPSRTAPPVDSGVAIIKQLVNVKWANGSKVRVGDALKPGQRLRLVAGSTQVQFYRGAVVTLEGPGELEIRSISDAILHSGKARAVVPEPAQGFTLHTPDVEVVDLGTEFGVEVVPGRRTEVSVFSGEVELYQPNIDRAMQEPTSLTTGQGMAVTEGARQEIAVDRDRFGSEQSLRQETVQQALDQFARWQAWSKATREDPRVLMYYSFESPNGTELVLPNETITEMPATGHVIGCRWTEGRWPRKRALDFKRPSDRIRFHLDGEYDSVTLAAWVRIDGLDRPLCSLMLTDGYEPGELHWQFKSNGELGLAIEGVCNHYSRPLVDLTDLGKWIHVASTYDRASHRVNQYFNGELVDTLEVTRAVATRFGDAEIANWSHPVSPPPKQIRNFNGRMDEFVLYSAALDAKEIRAMYEAGKPN